MSWSEETPSFDLTREFDRQNSNNAINLEVVAIETKKIIILKLDLTYTLVTSQILSVLLPSLIQQWRTIKMFA